ncbi:hypothetical protein M0C40_05720 [Spiroplasma citri]|uniref:Plectrovirus-related protein n=1 Tax=Spiroplasma citri TaxID=2133 RepID=A0AAX3SWF5_SPICI|nr:hypothetical protein [Spiroplasma citri]WFG95594.1 hypothetical protein M0C40_05720 [Spiroplasma citri]
MLNYKGAIRTINCYWGGWIMLEKLKDWIEIYNNNLKIEVKKLFLKEK